MNLLTLKIFDRRTGKLKETLYSDNYSININALTPGESTFNFLSSLLSKNLYYDDLIITYLDSEYINYDSYVVPIYVGFIKDFSEYSIIGIDILDIFNVDIVYRSSTSSEKSPTDYIYNIYNKWIRPWRSQKLLTFINIASRDIDDYVPTDWSIIYNEDGIKIVNMQKLIVEIFKKYQYATKVISYEYNDTLSLMLKTEYNDDVTILDLSKTEVFNNISINVIKPQNGIYNALQLVSTSSSDSPVMYYLYNDGTVSTVYSADDINLPIYSFCDVYDPSDNTALDYAKSVLTLNKYSHDIVFDIVNGKDILNDLFIGKKVEIKNTDGEIYDSIINGYTITNKIITIHCGNYSTDIKHILDEI